MASIFCSLITVFIVVLFARAVLSWFPPSQSGSFLAQISRVLYDLTEWALRPLRQVIPSAGMFDVSFLVLVFGLYILRAAVCS